MERITVSREAESDTVPTTLHVTIRNRVRRLRLFLLIAALVVCAGSAVALLLGRHGLFSGELAAERIAGVALVVLGLLLAAKLSWILFGRETYFINLMVMTVRRSIGPIGIRRTYRFADFRDERIVSRPGMLGLPPWKLLCLETQEESVVLRHGDHCIRLARDLDKAEGAYLLSAIHIWMHDQCDHGRSPSDLS
jgi:hypothetical protein